MNHPSLLPTNRSLLPTALEDMRFSKWLASAALGAIVMYLLDPDRGRARRAASTAVLRDLTRRSGSMIDQVVRRAVDTGFGKLDLASDTIATPNNMASSTPHSMPSQQNQARKLPQLLKPSRPDSSRPPRG